MVFTPYGEIDVSEIKVITVDYHLIPEQYAELQKCTTMLNEALRKMNPRAENLSNEETFQFLMKYTSYYDIKNHMEHFIILLENELSKK